MSRGNFGPRGEGKAPGERKISETAQTVGKKLFGESGAQDHLVILATQGGAQKHVRIEATTGDEAAAKVLAVNPGWRCAFVGPATDAPPTIDKTEAEMAA